MEIGVVYPQIELRGDPTAVRRIAGAVEDLGFDHLLAYEHVLGAVHADRSPPLLGPYTEHDPFHDPFVMFAYLAGAQSGSVSLPAYSSFPSARLHLSLAKQPMSIFSPTSECTPPPRPQR